MAPARCYRSRYYGRMNRRRRKALGLAGWPRERVWEMMAAEEERIAAALWWTSLSPWRRLWYRLLTWLKRALHLAHKGGFGPGGYLPARWGPNGTRRPTWPPRTGP